MRFAAIVLVSLLAVDPGGWDRFGPGRWGLVSSIGLGVVAAALLSEERRFWWPRWATIGWSMVVFSTAVSVALSADRVHALVGTPDRHLGLVTWVIFGGLFYAVGLRATSSRPFVSRAVVVGAGVSGAYALAELLGVDALDIDFASDRIGGTFGQPAYLGGAMALVVPITVGAALDRHASRLWIGAAWMAAALGVIGLAASQARAAWVGAAIGLLVVVVVSRPDLGSRRSIVIMSGAALVVVIAALATPLGSRAWALTDVEGGVVAGRMDEWEVGASALAGAEAGGLVGYGPEGYRTVFGRFVGEQYVIDHGRDAITDRAHNSLLDTALAGGLVAGLGLLVLQAGMTRVAVRAITHGDGTDVGMGVGVLAYVVQQLFLFPLAEVDPVFWIVGGLLVARHDAIRSRNVRGPLRPLAIGVGSILAGLALVAVVAGMIDVAADHRIDTASKRSDAAFAVDAHQLRPDSVRYAFIAARLSPTVDESLELLRDGLEISPHDPALLTEQGRRLLDRARLSGDLDHLSEALDALSDIDANDPNHPASQLRFGVALALSGRNDESVAAFRHAATLSPSDSEPLLNLALLYIDNNELARAAQVLDEAERREPADGRVQSLRDEISAE